MNQRRVRTTCGKLPAHFYSGSIDCFVQVSLIKNEILIILRIIKIEIGIHIYIPCKINFQTIKNEGLFALYKGFIPTLFRMGPWNIIFFITYEQLKKLSL